MSPPRPEADRASPAPRGRALLIAYQFPPLYGTSGVQRTLRLAQYLPEFGWEPVVLTASEWAYADADPATLSDIPPGCIVHRAWALDAARHLGIRGRYVSALARPDRWATWWLGAVPLARSLIARHRIRILWSTFPIPTAHRIGASVARASGLPWVADFRDPMAQDGYPSDPRLWRAYQRIEAATARIAARMTFTTPGARAMYAARYPTRGAVDFDVVENGFDEAMFDGVTAAARPDSRRMLLHSGMVYAGERDPSRLFEALAALKCAGRLDARRHVIRFRGSDADALLHRLAAEHRVTDLIDVAPLLPHREAIAELLSADGLLIMQGRDCNHQIPAKAYEYLRAGVPIVGLADPAGDTGSLLRSWGVEAVAALEDADAIARTLADGWIDGARVPSVDASRVASYSRRGMARRFAEMFDTLSA
jgi:glycosyltransferase involved in cell wall biosynthesis